MKKLLSLALTLAILAGCAPKYGEETAADIYVVDLKADVNDERMTLSWVKRGDGNIAGYNIYISEDPLVGKYPTAAIDDAVEVFNPTPFPGDTDPEDGVEHFEATGLDNGIKYYVSVRVLYPDQTVSKPSNEVTVVCGPRGEITLAVRYQSDRDGFSFRQNEYVRADDTKNDFYLFSKDGEAHLGSPKRLSGFINDTRFLVLPFRGTYDEVAKKLSESKYTATDDQTPIAVGDWVLLRCDDGAHALVNVLAIDGDGKDTTAKLYIAYSALVGEVFF